MTPPSGCGGSLPGSDAPASLRDPKRISSFKPCRHSRRHSTTPTTIDPTGYLTSTGRGVRIVVQARCTCGWARPSRAWSADCLSAENEDLDRHCYASRHQVLDQDDPTGIVHAVCAHVHDRHDDCPVPYDSPARLLTRTVRSSLTSAQAAADRLQAVCWLAAWDRWGELIGRLEQTRML